MLRGYSLVGWHLLWSFALLGLTLPGVAQPTHRPVDPVEPPPNRICSPVYAQNSGATYVAANHLTGTFGPADIGASGVTTTIDAGLFYGGTVVFSGTYAVHGDVRFVNGTFELRPGTVFYVEGLSGKSVPNPPYPPIEASTFLDVENANLELTGAKLLATCPRAWGGVRLGEYGRIRTQANPDFIGPGGRCLIRDAEVGVDVRDPAYGTYSTAEYYLNATDFVNNGIGLSDHHTYTARAGMGVHYCTFRTDAATLKAPITTANTPLIGVQLWIWDQPLGTNNYAAASIDHCDFRYLSTGVYGTAQQLRITDNTFDYLDRAVDLSLGGGSQGYFSFTPMYVERNNMLLRGTSPTGTLSAYGIVGGVYARDNYIHGDDANPAGNAVQQVGIYMAGPDNSTQTRNTFERLDQGIEVGIDHWGLNELDISGNLFKDVGQGISPFTYYTTEMEWSRLHIRCNSFENPGGLAGAVALNIEGPSFTRQLGSSASGNGNRFVTPGLPGIQPIDNNAGALSFVYYSFFSTQEDLLQAPQYGTTYSVAFTGGSPVTACSGAGYANGITSRSITPPLSLSTAALQNVYDSLRLTTPAGNRWSALLHTVLAAVAQQEDFTTLETYLAGLPASANQTHAILGSWLLAEYRTRHRDSDAQQVRTALLERHATNADVKSYIQLSDALIHLQKGSLRSGRPASADVAALRTVAGSGTAAARAACPLARRYEPACPCRFPTKGAAHNPVPPSRAGVPTPMAALGAAYPNPADASVRVPYTLPGGHGLLYLELRNALGQLVQRVALLDRAGEVPFAVGNLPAGLYHCALVGDGHPRATRQLAIIH